MDGANAIEYIITNNIEGDLVECGVDTAKQQVIWINSLLKYNKTRHIYMYDTFKGLTKPTHEDFMCEDYEGPQNMKDNFSGKGTLLKIWEKNIIDDNTNNWCYTSLENVQNTLNKTGYNNEYLHYICGDVCETLQINENIPEKISLLRLDTDWYESTKKELETLFDKVVKNGLIIFDDYYLWNGQQKAVNDYFKNNNLNYNVIKINEQTGYIIK